MSTRQGGGAVDASVLLWGSIRSWKVGRECSGPANQVKG